MKETLESWQVFNFVPHRQNSLQGFFDLKIIPHGLVIKGLAYHLNNGKPWISFPATAKPDKTGNKILRDNCGKVSFFNVCYFPSREDLNDFQAWAAAELRELTGLGGAS